MSSVYGDGARRSGRTPRTSRTTRETSLPAPRSARKTRGTTPVIDSSVVDASVAQRREVLSGTNQGYGTIGEAGISRTIDRVVTQQQVASTLEEAVRQAQSNMASSGASTNPSQVEDETDTRSNRSSNRNRHPTNRTFNSLQPVPEEEATRANRYAAKVKGDEAEDGDGDGDEEEEAEEEAEESNVGGQHSTDTTDTADLRQQEEEAELQRTFHMEGRSRNAGDIASLPPEQVPDSRIHQAVTDTENTTHRCFTTFQLWCHSLLTMLAYSLICVLALGALNRYSGRPYLAPFHTAAPEDFVQQGTPNDVGYVQSVKSVAQDIAKLGRRISKLETTSANSGKVLEELQDDVWGIAKLVRSSKPDSQPIPQVNFLSPIEMAAVDPRLTSPTATRPIQGWAMGAVAKLSGGILVDQSVPLGKHEYLQEDNTILRRNWCSNSLSGVAQKGWQLGYNMTPTELVLGWPAKGETVDGRSAPRDIELWVDLSHTNDEPYINQVKSVADATWPGIMDAPTFKTKSRASVTSNVVPWTMVPIGKWQYDFHVKKREQRFEVKIDIGQRKTDRVALRINSNWGSKQMVCLQDVALHGHYRGTPVDYAV